MAGQCPKVSKCSTVSSNSSHFAVGTQILRWFRAVFECTVTCNHVEDRSSAHLVLDVVAVKLVDSRKLIICYG